MKIVCVTGMRGCGKSVLGEVARMRGMPVFEMRDIVTDMMAAENIMLSNRNMREFAKQVREIHGKDIIAKKMTERIRASGTHRGLVLVVGVRGMYEVRAFREAFGEQNVKLLAIHSPPEARFQRVMRRTGKMDDPQSYDEFLWSDEMELGYGVSKAIALADVMVVNDGKLEEYIAKCNKVLTQLEQDGAAAPAV
ncbi:MAG: AAA family ATPase [Candidatus Micrarchaeota archaeon]|nr:AAA family ATPase [Candidatus Micrarchaeota archaeon]